MKTWLFFQILWFEYVAHLWIAVCDKIDVDGIAVEARIVDENGSFNVQKQIISLQRKAKRIHRK